MAGLVKETKADLVALNGENAREGFGLGPEDADRIFSMGVAVLTTGNHVWQKDELKPYLDQEERILRPDNYPPGAPGHGSCVVEARGIPVAFLNLQGRERMGASVDCPFRSGKKTAQKLRERAKIVIIDFHAESSGEKEALAYHLDGQVSAVLGTHTHVQTMDERILPGGTAYITDLGMCGPIESVIGTDPVVSVRRALTQMPLKMHVHEAPSVIRGVLLTVDAESGRSQSIERIVVNE
jgi:metallophosphoesterase (TIGR00282 family)